MPRAWVTPFDKSLLQGGPNATAFCHELRKHVEGKVAPYKWCVELVEIPAAELKLELTALCAHRIRGGFVLVDAVPVSPAGKILRRSLKDIKGVHVEVYEKKHRATIDSDSPRAKL